MKILFQVIKNYQSQEVAAVVVTTPNKKYYFNLPETFQRFMKNNKIKLNPSNAIFLTRLKTSHVCGLFGQMLTMFESKAAVDTIIFGPSGISQFFDKIRFKMGYKILPFGFYDFEQEKQFLYGYRKYETIMKLIEQPNYPKFFYEMNNYIEKNFKADKTLFEEEINNPNQFITDKNIFKDEICEVHPIFQKGNVMSYVIIPNKVQGKVLKDKLNQYGIKGKQITELINNGQITLPNGQTIYSNQVQEKALPSTIFMIIDCEGEDHLQDLKNNALIQSLLESNIDKESHVMTCIIHLAKFDIVMKEEYQNFFSKFSSECQHIFTCKELSEQGLPDQDQDLVNTNFSQFAFVETLNSTFNNNFSAFMQRQINYFSNGLIDVKSAFPLLKKCTVAKRYFEYHLLPLKNQGYFPFQGGNQKEFFTNEEVDKKLKEYLESYKKSQINIEQFNNCDFTKYNPEVVFLGTGSMKPAQYRNVSAIYIRNDKNNHGIILDCGEGSYYQLLNQYGEDRVQNEILPNLKIIFITHIHSDHHLGTLNMIRQRHLAIQKQKLENKISENEDDNELFLVVPFNMAPWLQAYSEMIEELNCKIVFNQQISKFENFNNLLNTSIFGSMSKESQEYYEHPKQNDIIIQFFNQRDKYLQAFKSYLQSQNIIEFTAVPVDHCPQSYAVVIQHANNVKICYSGDLRPSDNFINASKNATLFIHEATFNDDLQENAEKNMHCTVKEATISAIQANAWRLVLTHFSQRYQKVALPNINKESITKDDLEYYEYLENNSVLAFDHLTGQVTDYETLPFKTRLAQDLFPSNNNE
ncbi:hypothetical protein ABPG74_016888 [Tetrahymena malaccensis]